MTTTAIVLRLVLFMLTAAVALAFLAADPTDAAFPNWLNLVANGGSLVLLAVLLVYIVPRVVREQREREDVRLTAATAERAELTRCFREEIKAERTSCDQKFDRLYAALAEQGVAIKEKTHILQQHGDALNQIGAALQRDMVASETMSRGMMTILNKIESNQLAAAERGGRRRGADGPTPGGPT